jgi:hypothetical protein
MTEACLVLDHHSPTVILVFLSLLSMSLLCHGMTIDHKLPGVGMDSFLL